MPNWKARAKATVGKSWMRARARARAGANFRA
jgi:hypothetical protein